MMHFNAVRSCAEAHLARREVLFEGLHLLYDPPHLPGGCHLAAKDCSFLLLMHSDSPFCEAGRSLCKGYGSMSAFATGKFINVSHVISNVQK